VLQGAVADTTRSSAPDATSGLEERTAASTSSVDAQGENWSCGVSSAARWAEASARS
jgi:hypothetical protein